MEGWNKRFRWVIPLSHCSQQAKYEHVLCSRSGPPVDQLLAAVCGVHASGEAGSCYSSEANGTHTAHILWIRKEEENSDVCVKDGPQRPGKWSCSITCSPSTHAHLHYLCWAQINNSYGWLKTFSNDSGSTFCGNSHRKQQLRLTFTKLSPAARAGLTHTQLVSHKHVTPVSTSRPAFTHMGESRLVCETVSATISRKHPNEAVFGAGTLSNLSSRSYLCQDAVKLWGNCQMTLFYFSSRSERNWMSHYYHTSDAVFSDEARSDWDSFTGPAQTYDDTTHMFTWHVHELTVTSGGGGGVTDQRSVCKCVETSGIFQPCSWRQKSFQ